MDNQEKLLNRAEIKLEDVRSIIDQMITVPHISPIDPFETFSTSEPKWDDSEVKNDDITDLISIGDGSTLGSMLIYSDNVRIKEDPEFGAHILVCKAVRQMVSNGVTPKAICFYVNHISPFSVEDQKIASAVKHGVDDAAKAFDLKLVDRKMYLNMFFVSDMPTLSVALWGTIEKDKNRISTNLVSKGNTLFLFGSRVSSLSGSEYIRHCLDIDDHNMIYCNLAEDKKVNDITKKLIDQNLIESASPVGIGGLFFTLLRSCYKNSLGFDITSLSEIDLDQFLFNESMGRMIIEVSADKIDGVVDLFKEVKIPSVMIGHITKGEIRIDDMSMGHTNKL